MIKKYWIICMVPLCAHTSLAKKIIQPDSPLILNYLGLPHHYNLKTTQAIKNYLPTRLKALQKEISRSGIQAAIQTLATDPDLDSFLFIIDAEKPHRILAYSRTPDFTQKTPDELQQLLAPQCNSSVCSIKNSIDQIASIAQKITTYTAYWWPTNTSELQHYMAYASMVVADKKNYIIGVTMPYPRAEVHIVLPHRINQVLALIKKDGLEKMISTINKDLDYGYFFVIDLDYPHRFLTHREPWAGLTPEQARDSYSPNCTNQDCDVAYISKGLVATAREYKEGFYIYLWKNKPTAPATLKIAYVKSFEYKGKKYLLGTGLPADIPGDQAKDIMQFVDDGIAMVKEIGLDNAISAIKRLNKSEKYLFIGFVKPPYKFILHASPYFDDKTSAQGQAYLSAHGQNAINVDSVFKKIGSTAQKGGGFLAYEWFEDAQSPQSAITLKVAYTKPFTFNGIEYTMSSGIPIDQAQAAAAALSSSNVS